MHPKYRGYVRPTENAALAILARTHAFKKKFRRVVFRRVGPKKRRSYA